MAIKPKQVATSRARLFPTTYSWLSIQGAKANPRMTIAEVVEAMRQEVLKSRRAKVK